MFTEASPSSLGKSRCAGSLKWNIISARASPRGWGIDLGSPGLCISPPSIKEMAKRTKCQTKLKGTEILAWLSRWSRYRYSWYRNLIFLPSVTSRLFDFRNIHDISWRFRLENCSKTPYWTQIKLLLFNRLNLNFSFFWKSIFRPSISVILQQYITRNLDQHKISIKPIRLNSFLVESIRIKEFCNRSERKNKLQDCFNFLQVCLHVCFFLKHIPTALRPSQFAKQRRES